MSVLKKPQYMHDPENKHLTLLNQQRKLAYSINSVNLTQIKHNLIYYYIDIIELFTESRL